MYIWYVNIIHARLKFVAWISKCLWMFEYYVCYEWPPIFLSFSCFCVGESLLLSSTANKTCKMATICVFQKVKWEDVHLWHQDVLHQRFFSFSGCLPWKVIFYQRVSSINVVIHQSSSSINHYIPSNLVFLQRSSKVVFYQRLSSIKGCLLLKVIFYWRSASIKGCPPLKIFYHQRSYSIEGLSLNILFHRRSSSIEGCPPSKDVFHGFFSPSKESLHQRFL